MFLSPDSARKKNAAIYPGLPLQGSHIRVVRLLPGRWTEPIRCELWNVNIEVAKYRALSYVWGSQHMTRLIRLDGRRYPVTVNLEGALKHLREAYKDGLDLWVDALCINQKDGEERNHQVQLMGLIYKKCEECIVYLGDSLDNASPSLTETPEIRHFEYRVPAPSGKRNSSGRLGVYEIFQFFHGLSSNKHLDTQPIFDNDAESLKTGSHRDQPQSRSQLFETLRRFTHAPFTPWWTRIWVIQEVTTPPRVVVTYGMISASWDIFAKGAAYYTHHSATCCKKIVQGLPSDQQKVVADSCKKIIGIESLRRTTHSSSITHTNRVSLGLLSLLTHFRDRKASDPRDKVYALLSMAWTPPGRTPLTPDYSLSEKSVFCKAALESIYTTESLSMFSTELGRKFRNDLPSWVPDWGAPGGHTYAARTQTILLYNANREKATPLTVRSITESALRLRAARITTVGVLGETMLGDDAAYTRQTLLQWLSLWFPKVLAKGRFPDETPVDEHFVKLICAGVIHHTHGELPHGVRTVQAYDARTFESWAVHSRMSPVRKADDSGVIDDLSVSVQLWNQFVLLWPHGLVPKTLDPLSDRDDYLPTGLENSTLDLSQNMARLRRLLHSLKYGMRRLDYFEIYRPRRFASWKDLFVKAQKVLQIEFGPDINPDLGARRGLIPDIDGSINIATLSRRLIIGENSLRSSPATGKQFSGLGPAGTIEGDEVFLLTGGKTPFVLRRRDDADDTIPGPKYEIIGDCYLQGWMDGEGEGLALDNWEDITLV